MPAREGQTLNANQSTPTILQIADLDTMTVRAQVAEADVMKLKEGMGIYFTTLGNVDRRWQGRVRQILPSPQVVNDVVLYDVLIDVRNEGRQLMNGMTTQVFFVFGKAEDTVIVPAEALSRRAQEKDSAGGRAYVVTVQNGERREDRVIYVGLQTRTQAAVIAGLDPGERIVLQRPEGAAASAQNSASQQRGGTRRFSSGPVL
jgi:macrolide-specific efflux system membrane fusion protein